MVKFSLNRLVVDRQPRLAAALLVFGSVAVCGALLGSGAEAFSRKTPAPTPAAAQSPSSSASQAGTATAIEKVWVARADGAESCAPGSGQSLEIGAADLRKLGVRVLDSRKGTDGQMHAQMCGMPTGSTNAYLIPKEDLSRALANDFVLAK
jgi:hypothetical protein